MWSSYPEYLFLINTLTAALFGPLCPYFLSPSLHDYLHPFVFNSFSLSPSFHWPLHSLLYPQIPLSVQVDEANSHPPTAASPPNLPLHRSTFVHRGSNSLSLHVFALLSLLQLLSPLPIK